MFAVEIAPDARAAIEAKFKERGWTRPGVMVLRQGPKADVSRSKDGQTVWRIERPGSPWSLYMGSLETYRDDEFQTVNGIRVYLALIPRDGEKGVALSLKHGELVVETID